MMADPGLILAREFPVNLCFPYGLRYCPPNGKLLTYAHASNYQRTRHDHGRDPENRSARNLPLLAGLVDVLRLSVRDLPAGIDRSERVDVSATAPVAARSLPMFDVSGEGQLRDRAACAMRTGRPWPGPLRVVGVHILPALNPAAFHPPCGGRTPSSGHSRIAARPTRIAASLLRTTDVHVRRIPCGAGL